MKEKIWTVYVAHKYGRRRGLSDAECEYNVKRVIIIGRQLILAGYNPFIPNLYHFVHLGWNLSPNEDTWHMLVSHWLQFCDALLVASEPVDENSGVQMEIDEAEQLGIPVFYSIGELLAYDRNSEVSTCQTTK